PLPPDLQKPPRKPNTNIASDKDRIAMSRHPELDKSEKTLVSPPAGRPGQAGPRAAQPSQPAPAVPPSQIPQQQQPAQPHPTQRPQFQTDQTAQLESPARPNAFSKYNENQSAGSATQQATQAAAANRGAGGGGQEGDFGLNTGAKGRQYGAFD